jgi:hypothetical protein
MTLEQLKCVRPGDVVRIRDHADWTNAGELIIIESIEYSTTFECYNISYTVLGDGGKWWVGGPSTHEYLELKDQMYGTSNADLAYEWLNA